MGKPAPVIFCSTRFLLTWLAISTVACLLYATIVFVSLLDKNVLPTDDGPDSIPYINIPSKYNVTLRFETEFDKSNTTFTGSVVITFLPGDENQRIYVHRGENIRLGDYRLTSEENDVSVKKGTYNSQAEIQTFIPSRNLTRGVEYSLELSFVGQLNQKNGPVEFSYKLDKETRYGVSFISTRSASKGLRYLFPSLDSKNFPAIFDLNVKRKISLRVLSNYPATTTSPELPYMLDFLPAQARLYPNQVGLVLCDFPYSREDIDNLTITVYYRPSVLSGISIRRLRQFMDKSSSTIGKIDAVVLPNSETVHQPGLSILNEVETITENNAFASVAEQNNDGTTTVIPFNNVTNV